MRVCRIDYPGSSLYREFRFDGDTLVYLNEGGTVYERIREGNTYLDVWRINGSNTNLWLGAMSAWSDHINDLSTSWSDRSHDCHT